MAEASKIIQDHSCNLTSQAEMCGGYLVLQHGAKSQGALKISGTRGSAGLAALEAFKTQGVTASEVQGTCKACLSGRNCIYGLRIGCRIWGFTKPYGTSNIVPQRVRFPYNKDPKEVPVISEPPFRVSGLSGLRQPLRSGIEPPGLHHQGGLQHVIAAAHEGIVHALSVCQGLVVKACRMTWASGHADC